MITYIFNPHIQTLSVDRHLSCADDQNPLWVTLVFIFVLHTSVWQVHYKRCNHAGKTKKIDSVLYWIYGSISVPLSSWSRSLSEQHLRNINHCSVAIWRANEMLRELNKISVLCVTTWLWDFLQCYQTPTIVLVKNICNILLVLPQANKNNVPILYPYLWQCLVQIWSIMLISSQKEKALVTIAHWP